MKAPLSSFDTGGFLQFTVIPGNPEANLLAVEKGLTNLPPRPAGSKTMIVLPELWATGFTYGQLPNLSHQTEELLARLQELAARHTLYLAGSLPERCIATAQTHYYNTLYLTGPEGIVGQYRKQRLFAPMAEDRFFTPGRDPGPLATPVGPVATLICYDLRFPELTRRQTSEGAALLIIAAQWPMVRVDHWQTLIRARAIENQIFVIAANACGLAGETLFAGHSMIVAPDGSILQEAGADPETGLAHLNRSILDKTRGHFNTTMIEESS